MVHTLDMRLLYAFYNMCVYAQSGHETINRGQGVETFKNQFYIFELYDKKINTKFIFLKTKIFFKKVSIPCQ